MEVTHNHNAKSQLAKLLASENITVQHQPGAKTAWFDVKNRVLCLPVWREMSNDLYDLLVVHEVGHALDTPADGWMDAIKAIAERVYGGPVGSRAQAAVKGFLNVIEDARIDKRQKRRFPGSRRNYVKGYAELIERDFFGTAKRDVNSMSFIDRLNIYCKGGAMLGIKFSPEERKMLTRVEATETFEEVLALTEEIFAWSKNKNEEKTTSDDDFGMESEDSDGEGDDDSDDDFDWGNGDSDSDDESDDDGEAGEASDEDSDDEADDTDGDGSEDSEDADDGKPQSKDEKSDEDAIQDGATAKSNGSGDGDDENVPESETDKAWEKSQEDLVLNSNTEYVYIKIPRPKDINRIVVDYKQVLKQQREYISRMDASWISSIRAELVKFRSNENATISFMVKEFEMRKSADEYSRTSVSKTGVIDTNKLHSYKYNDDLFRRITTVATGKNHGFVMFVDWSGSMDYNMKKTLRQMFSLAMFCKRVQIPFEVYSFRSVNSRDIDKGYVGPTEHFFTTNQNGLEFDNLFVRNILSSRMNVAELNEAMLNLFVIAYGGHVSCDNMGSTPLNECIGVADLIVNRFRAQSKVQVVNTIFLTDGQSDIIYNVHGVQSSWKTRQWILQDEITKKSYDLKANNYEHNPYASKQMTVLLLKVLKDRTGCNLIGFYINGDGFDSVYRTYYGYGGGDHYSACRKQYNAEGWYPVTTGGYDEYYILNPKFFDVASGKLTVDSSTMTKNKMAKEFIKFSEKKAVSRVLLTRFVKRIAA